MTILLPRLLPLLALAPLAGVAALWLLRRRRRALAAWAQPSSWRRLGLGAESRRRSWPAALLLAVAVAGIALALTRPRWGQSEIPVEQRGVDVVLVVDTSYSMAALDARPSRLSVAKSLARRLLAELPGHRFGLVALEGEGSVLVPMTTDAAAVELSLDALEPGSLPTPGTALAAAVATAVELFPVGETHRVVVVLSDGEDHEGGLGRALEALRTGGVVAHAIAIGTVTGAPLPAPFDPRRLPDEPRLRDDSFKRDADGRVVISRRQDDALRQLAERTGGRFLVAEGAALDPAPIAESIGSLERRRLETLTVAAQPERFQWPLALAALALAGWLIAHLPPRPRRPAARRRAPAAPARAGRPRQATSALVLAAALVSLAASSPEATSPSSPPWLERWRYNPVERTAKGLAALDDERAQEAIERFDSAARLAPDDPRTLYNAGVARLAAGRATEAADWLQRAAEQAEGEGASDDQGLAADAWYNLGNARLASGDPAAAAEAYRAALRRQPERLGAKHNLELALRQLEGSEGAGRDGDSEQNAGDEGSEGSDSPAQEGMDGDGSPNQQRQGPAPPPETAEETADDGALARTDEPSASEAPADDRALPRRFEPQPEMSAEQALALLDAIEALERERRRDEQRRRRPSTKTGRGKDW
jgi:Ca-activated chloride channel family protein